MNKGVVYASYGLGGAAVETWNNGLRLLVQRCKAVGFDTRSSPYNWNDTNIIIADINKQPDDALIGLGGSSLGDDAAPGIAVAVKHKIRYLFGFQDSTYAATSGVPHNVDFADNIYNPNWWETFGLGSGKWYLALGNGITKLRNIPLKGMAHPDDWGVAQDIVFSRLHALLGGANA